MSIKSIIGALSLGANINKVKDEDRETIEGVISDYLPELKVDLKDEELLKLSKHWTDKWDKYNKNLKKRQERCEKYWLGVNNFDGDILNLGTDEPNSDNLIFEALETFLPIATKKNPEPVVLADGTEEGYILSKKMSKMLISLADTLSLKMKGKTLVRHWALYFLGVGKVGWSQIDDDISLSIIRPQRIILDSEAYIDEKGEYSGEYIGEIKTDTAENLIKRFPSKEKYIKEKANGMLGTSVNYTEWWTDDMVFWKFENEILDKIRNPHWNYDKTENATEVDDFGNESDVVKNVVGINHFLHPKKPYIFLSVFNIGNRPNDNTSLIEQNIFQQNKINKRQKQIDENVDNMNNGWVVSLANAGLTKEQASSLAHALQKGNVAVIPNGTPRNAIDRISGAGLPADVFNSLVDARNELRGVFGITGLTPQGTSQEQTVRGKIITREQDSTRIGGGITDYLEQWYDHVFNWFVQMIYVYYTEEKMFPVLGIGGSQEYISIINSEFKKKLVISIKEGSLIPKDDLTRRNEAIDLWGAGAIDPLTLFELLDFPNPKEAVNKLVMWQTNPAGLMGGQQPAVSPEMPVNPQENILNNVQIQ